MQSFKTGLIVAIIFGLTQFVQIPGFAQITLGGIITWLIHFLESKAGGVGLLMRKF
jgi:xanthosine utilization system XapX-like protein